MSISLNDNNGNRLQGQFRTVVTSPDEISIKIDINHVLNKGLQEDQDLQDATFHF